MCDKGFYRKHNLRVHELTHLASNNFQCDACAKSFAQKANYIRHMNNTHERPAKCPLCSFRVTSDTELATHLRETHPAADPARVKLRVRGHRGVTYVLKAACFFLVLALYRVDVCIQTKNSL